MFFILVINPGSTSSKIAIFRNKEKIFEENLIHKVSEGSSIEEIIDIRKKDILECIEKNGFSLDKIDGIACRGGILCPMEGGTYSVNDELVYYSLNKSIINHPSNFAAPVGFSISNGKIPVFITDPISTDEFWEYSRLSGLPEIPRISLLHALNMKAVAKKTNEKLGKVHGNYVIAHLGGGFSIGLMVDDKIVDVNNAMDEGPFSPNRTGTLPVLDLAKKAFSGEFNKTDFKRRYTKFGGLLAYTGNDNVKELLQEYDEDPEIKLVIDAMIYQIAKEIGGMCTVGSGKIDGIILTGGLAKSDFIVNEIKKYVNKFGKLFVYPGEMEMEALALGTFRVLNGEEKAKSFVMEGEMK
ncbi:MAG: butyrate kinase [Kosmotogales bacterium]|nr:butyrate kinase [Kosmotogales bacterium]